MLIRHLDGIRFRDLHVAVADPDATVADLAAALEPLRPAGPLLVDGRVVAAPTPLDRAAIAHGATVRRPPEPGLPPPPASPARGLVLTVTAGPDSGRSLRLPPGTHLVGRSAAPAVPIGEVAPCPAGEVGLHDPTVSAHHATLEVSEMGTATVIDVGSTNGTWLGDAPVKGATVLPPGAEVRCGATRFVLGPRPLPSGAGRPQLAGAARTRPLHRRPRPEPPGPMPAVAVPADAATAPR